MTDQLFELTIGMSVYDMEIDVEGMDVTPEQLIGYMDRGVIVQLRDNRTSSVQPGVVWITQGAWRVQDVKFTDWIMHADRASADIARSPSEAMKRFIADLEVRNAENVAHLNAARRALEMLEANDAES